jgi:hypothetical protein
MAIPQALCEEDAINVAIQYRSLLLTCLSKETTGSTEWQFLQAFETAWSLAILCIFHTTAEDPIEFVDGYLRWVQFHFAGN